MVLTFYMNEEDEETKGYCSQVSRFNCELRPQVGEIWRVPAVRDPFNDHGELEKLTNDEILFLKVLAVQVDISIDGRPHNPDVTIICEDAKDVRIIR